MLDMKRIVEIINSLGIRPYTFDYSIYSAYVLNCYNWYKSDVPHFHTITRYNGSTNVTYGKAKLHMAKRVCEDLASLVCNQNMTIRIDDKKERDFILGNDEMTGILGQNDFWNQFNKCFELTAGLGTGAIEIVAENLLQVDNKLVANKNTNIKIVRHDCLHILPLEWDSDGKITQVAFIDEYRQVNDVILELRLHIKNDNGNYIIINKKCKMLFDNSNNATNKFIYVENDGIIDEFDTGSNIPLFTCLKMPQINSYDINSVLGASCFGDATDILRSIDDIFDTLCSEFRFSKKTVYMPKSMLEIGRDGKAIIPTNDEYTKQVYYYLGDSLNGNNTSDKIQETNPEIRSKEITEGMDLALDLLSFMCGLGHSFYKFSNGTVQKTATEVVSENSDLYRNICKMQLAIEKNIYEIIKALLYLNNYLFGTDYNIDCNMSVDFDASIIEDKTAERERALKEVELGLLTPDEYRAKYYPELVIENKSGVTKDM